jgi:hypothetical protein
MFIIQNDVINICVKVKKFNNTPMEVQGEEDI